MVAAEVKDLARETARATEDIDRQVFGIQADAASAIASISGISDVIERINSFQTIIASAVEEQNATTSGMADALQRAATGAGDISTGMREVVVSSTDNKAAAETADLSAGELAVLAERLQHAVSAFRL